MPRGKKNSVAKDAPMAPSPKSTRSSRRGKNVEIPSVSKSNVSSGQKDIESKMKSGASKNKSTPKNSVSKKNKVTTTAISTSDDVITPKSKASVKNKIQEKKSNSASVETPASICDQTSVRKSARSKKETNKFSEWKEKGSKSQKKDAELGKSNNMEDSNTKGKKKTDKRKTDVETNDDDGKDSSLKRGKKKASVEVLRSRSRKNSPDVADQTEKTKKEEPTGARGRGRKGDVKNANSSVKKNSQKRKLSQENIETELLDTSKKPKMSPVKKKSVFSPRKRSISKSLNKAGKENAPRKTLGNRDILGLLDEDPEDPIADEPEPEPEKSPNTSANVSSRQKVPVWRQQETNKTVQTAGNDVFDLANYGEEEFGPEDVSVLPVKKKARRKKKDTKAILVFGNNQSNGIKKVVKEAHNLKTPGAGKKTRKMTSRKAPEFEIFPSEVPNSPNPQVTVTTFSSDVSTGDQNLIRTGLDIENPEPNNSNLKVPQKIFTPIVSKTSARLKSGSCSTPNVTASRQKPVATTVKEQMKNAFGFDDTEDELSEPENTSLLISPVKKVKNPVLEMFEGDSILEGRGAARLSTIPGITAGAGMAITKSSGLTSKLPVEIVSKEKEGPFRVILPSKTKVVERDLLAQVKALREKELLDKKKKPKTNRTSPRKKFSKKDPIVCSTLLEDPSAAPKQKDIREMFEAVKNKQEQPESDSVVVSEASSLYDDLSLADETEQKDETNAEKIDKENVNVNNESPIKKVMKPTVNKVYKRRKENTINANDTTSTFIKSPDQSSKLGSPRKETKKVKAFNQWAKHQTSHFSEVEDFDLSFT